MIVAHRPAEAAAEGCENCYFNGDGWRRVFLVIDRGTREQTRFYPEGGLSGERAMATELQERSRIPRTNLMKQ